MDEAASAVTVTVSSTPLTESDALTVALSPIVTFASFSKVWNPEISKLSL